MKNKLIKLKDELKKEIRNIISFWLSKVIDLKNKKLYGKVLSNGNIIKDSPISLVLITRILWTFSKCYLVYKNRKFLNVANFVYEYFMNNFYDKKYKGFFWMVDNKGKMIDDTKKFYGLSFAIYALSEYYKITLKKEILNLIYETYEIIEKKGKDKIYGGYVESAKRDFSKIDDMRLSEKDLNAPKSMNAHLHIMEAYANMVEITQDKNIQNELKKIINIFLKKIIQKNGHLGLFFDMRWKLITELVSYGHDIEASWLLYEAALHTNDNLLIKKVKKFSIKLANVFLKEGLDTDNGVNYEGDKSGPFKEKKEWWMQVEAMVGFLNAYELTKNEIYIEKLFQLWNFCKKNFKSPLGEWYYFIDKNGKPVKEKELAGPWKCPYHSIRAFLEMRKRIEKIIIKMKK